MSWIASSFRSIKKLSLPLVVMAALASVAQAATTLENMQAAFNGESNAHLRYLAFAQRAESEGYGEVASLFRAAARAEEIHAANHAEVIKEMGATPQAHIDTLTVQSTRENLETALKGETWERDTMYPGFEKQAQSDDNARALRSLNYARAAETEHARLFTEALANLPNLKGTTHTVFYVCPTCGFTMRDASFAKCPTCFTAKGAFELVS
ncbi:MAG: rubrerythrin family protein [Acidobacteriota bacterium]